MNPKGVMLGCFGLGLLGAAVGVTGYFDGQLVFCQPTANGCLSRSVPEWMALNQAVTHVKRVPGAAGWKLGGAALGTAAFGASMCIARKLASEEPLHQRIQTIWDGAELAKTRLSAEMDIRQYHNQLMLQAAERAYSLLGRTPNQQKQQQPLLEGDSLDEVTDPSDKIANADTSKEPLPEQPAGNPAESDSLSAAPPTQPTSGLPTGKVLHKDSESVAMAILDGLVGSRKSTLLIGGTGAGKSVTEAYILTKLFERYPQAEVWAIAQKNDSFCGLDKKKRVVIFDVLNPSEALGIIDHIHSIYDQRRRLPEAKRKDLPPVRLVLADWLSINRALEEMKNEEPVKGSKYLVKISDIIYNGRDMNVCIIADLQSFNLAAIGVRADRNSRKNFNLVGLGNYYTDELDGITESYGVLENMIGDRNIVSTEAERSRLLQIFQELKPISMKNERPIIFTTLEPARVGLLPDLRHYKPGEIPRVKLEGYTPEQLNRILSLEFEIDCNEQPAEQCNSTPENSPTSLSELQQKIVEYLKGKGVKDINSIKDTRSIKGTPVQEVREALNGLIKAGWVISEAKNSYRLVE